MGAERGSARFCGGQVRSSHVMRGSSHVEWSNVKVGCDIAKLSSGMVRRSKV